MMAGVNTNDRPKGGKWRKPIRGFLLGLAFGSLGAFGMIALLESGRAGDLGVSAQIACLVGLVYLAIALATGFGAASPKLGAGFLNVEDADELREQRRILAYSSMGVAAIGAALILLALAAPAGPVAAPVALAGTIVLVAFACLLSVRQWRLMDELMRDLSRETAAAAFYLVALVGGGWAMLAHLGFVAGPAMLDWLSLIAGVMLIGAMAACFGRGLLTPR